MRREPGATPTAADRIRAFLWDYLIMAAYLLVLTGVGSWLAFGPLQDAWGGLFDHPAKADLMAFVLLVLPVVLYFTLAESSRHQGTPGKRRRGLQVVDAVGRRVGRGQALVRNVLRFLPWQLAHTAMFNIPGFPTEVRVIPAWSTALLVCAWLLVGVYLLGLTRLAGGRPLYDLLAGTRVVEEGNESALTAYHTVGQSFTDTNDGRAYESD